MNVSTRKGSASTTDDWWHPYRQSRDVTVFHVDLQPHGTRETDALEWLDRKEQARWHRFRHSRARYEFSLCRAALRAILCAHLNCGNEQLAFGTSEYGKPHALVDGAPEDIGFNVSHSYQHGLVALALHGRIGVDVEERNMQQNLDGAVESVFTPNERAELAAVHDEQKIHFFFRLWTMKEALLKALGTGFSLDMSKIEIPKTLRQGMNAGEFCFPQLPAVRWWLESMDDPDFAAALAHELGPGRAKESRVTPGRGCR